MEILNTGMYFLQKKMMKKTRRSETQGFQRVDASIALERSTWYHLTTNSCQQMLNTLTRIGEPMREHADNSFNPLSKSYVEERLKSYGIELIDLSKHSRLIEK